MIYGIKEFINRQRAKIKARIINWLGVDNLTKEYRRLHRECADTYKEYQRTIGRVAEMQQQREFWLKDLKHYEELRLSILADMGAYADITPHGPSVVVVAKRGDNGQNLVKVYEFRRTRDQDKHLDDVRKFLEQFPPEIVVVDGPRAVGNLGISHRMRRGGIEPIF